MTFAALAKNTVPASGAGLPGISLPMGSAGNGLPIGLEIDARLWRDRRLLSARPSGGNAWHLVSEDQQHKTNRSRTRTWKDHDNGKQNGSTSRRSKWNTLQSTPAKTSMPSSRSWKAWFPGSTTGSSRSSVIAKRPERFVNWRRSRPLSIFGFRDHGAAVQVAGLQRQAIQYDIGNPLTATKMTRHRISAGLYAPIRVLLREDSDGVAFEYDRPISTFGQFGDPDVDEVARKLDKDLQAVLESAAA